MPISFDDYDASTVAMDPGSNAFRILTFLAEYPELGFTPKEIHNETGVPRGSVGTTLTRLEERGLVNHKEPYWSINESALGALDPVLTGLEAVEKSTTYEWGEADPAASRIGLDAVIADESTDD